MCKPILSLELLSNEQNLIEQLGGKSQLDFVLINFCESVKEDSELRVMFNHMNSKQFCSAMSSLVTTAFETNVFDDKERNGVVMKHYTLFELGISSNNFQTIKDHFECALRSCWIGEELIESCTQRFGALQSIFEAEGAPLRNTANAHRALASRFQAAPAAA